MQSSFETSNKLPLKSQRDGKKGANNQDKYGRNATGNKRGRVGRSVKAESS